VRISDEAVDAAVDALVASRLGDHAGISGEEFVEAARAALEAAAPYLSVEAPTPDSGSILSILEASGVAKANQFDALVAVQKLLTNPYRSQA
jgi:hypothetical protein